MRQLLIAHDYPPILSPESIQSSRLVSALESEGWETTVLTTSITKFHPVDKKLLISGDVVRAKTLENRFINKFLSIFAESFLYCPDAMLLWMPFALFKGRRIIEKNKIDVMHSWSTPNTSHLIALKMKEKYDTPWVAHFSDPWTDNPYRPKLNKFLSNLNIKWEKKVIENADALVFTSKETVELIMSKYDNVCRNKTFVLPHTYDPNIVLKKNIKTNSYGKIIIAHVGNFYGSRTPEDFFMGLAAAKSQISGIGDKISVKLIGGVPQKYIQVAKDLGLLEIVDFLGTVSYEESINCMQSADILLTVDAPSEKSVFLPCKLVEYIGNDKPILALTSLEGTTARVLKELGHLVVKNDEHEKLADLFSKLFYEGLDWIKFKKEGKIEYQPQTVAHKLADIFNSII